jgi:uncharacterized membrane protein
MTKTEFLETLRRRLAGMSPQEIDDVIGDYTTHFADAAAAGRSEEDVAAALGDPMRLARELRAESGFRRWEEARTPANFLAVIFGLLALIAVDFVFLLPVLGGLLLFALIAAAAILTFLGIGAWMIVSLFFGDSPFLAGNETAALGFTGLSFLGFGIGSGALLLILGEVTVRALGHFARLHFTLINRANQAA